MPVKDKATLKSYFEPKKVPTEANYIDLIDSIPEAGGGGTVTSLATSAPITGGPITGSGTIGIDAATPSLPGSMSAADKTKLDGIAAGANVGISPVLNSSQIIVGNSSNVATPVTMSGDGAISNTGLLSINKTRLNVRNETGVTIAAGRAVYVSGFNNFPLISLADNTDEAKHNVIGVTIAAIAHQANGVIATHGQFDCETNSWTVGTELYLSTSGTMVPAEPTSGAVMHVGIVTVQQNYPTGKLLLYMLPEGNTVGVGANQSAIVRLGDSAGATKLSIRDYANSEVASINSDGKIETANTGLVTNLNADQIDSLHASEFHRVYLGYSTNFNNSLTQGDYQLGSGSTVTGAPYAGSIYGKLRVYLNDGATHDNATNWIWQYFDDTAGACFMRNKTNAGSWSSWTLLRDNYTPLGWITAYDIWSYAGVDQITVPAGALDKYAISDKFWFWQATGGYKYFSVVGVTDTVLTITGGSDYTLTNEAITANRFSKAANPQYFPHWFNWEAAPTGYATNLRPTNFVYRFKIEGKNCIVYIREVSTGTSNASTITFVAPVVAKTITNMTWTGFGNGTDNNVTLSTTVLLAISSGGTAISAFKDPAAASWTESGNKRVSSGNIMYEIG